MGKYQLKLPKMGESIAEATITKWLKDVGDNVEIDESLVEIATDKVDSDVPSEYKGKLIKKNFEVNDVVKVGEVIAEIETDMIDNDNTIIKSKLIISKFPKIKDIENNIINKIIINWYLSVIIESLNPPLKIYKRHIINVNPADIHKGVFEIKFIKKAIAVTSAIKKIVK